MAKKAWRTNMAMISVETWAMIGMTTVNKQLKDPKTMNIKRYDPAVRKHVECKLKEIKGSKK